VKFVDTSFWIGFFIQDDGRHPDARELWSRTPGALLTTNHVLGETWTLLRRRQRHEDALRAVSTIRASRRVTVVRVPQATEDAAWEWLTRHSDRKYSFVDATSFALMRRRRMREAFAFDGDFTAAGFIEVRP
jgi:predicted nucleic acid-binding protein